MVVVESYAMLICIYIYVYQYFFTGLHMRT